MELTNYSNLTREERERRSLGNIKELIEEYQLNMTVDEFIKTYSGNKGVKCTATNVWNNIYEKEYYLKGNKKYLLNLLNNPLAFLEPTGKVITEAQKKASAKYDKENTKQIALKLNIHTDKDIIEFLDKVENKQGLIKDLIRNAIKRR